MIDGCDTYGHDIASRACANELKTITDEYLLTSLLANNSDNTWYRNEETNKQKTKKPNRPQKRLLVFWGGILIAQLNHFDKRRRPKASREQYRYNTLYSKAHS